MWLTVGLSLLFSFTVFINFRLFGAQTVVVNLLDKDILVTPFGRERSTEVTNIPLSFRYPQISSPFNKNIKVSKQDSLALNYDIDVCLLDGVLFEYDKQFYRYDASLQAPDKIVITPKDLRNKAKPEMEKLASRDLTDYKPFIIQSLIVAYAPLIIFWKFRRNRKKTSH